VSSVFLSALERLSESAEKPFSLSDWRESRCPAAEFGNPDHAAELCEESAAAPEWEEA